jgi:hypothetical protein
MTGSIDDIENDMCNVHYLAQINQRLQLQLFQSVVPPVRLELGDNPYASGAWTSGQLAMRRKFNILQYPRTAGAAARGGATVSQQYTRLLRGGSVVARRMAHPSPEDARFSICDIRNPISVGSSDVPRGGDVDALFLDPAAPLYLTADPRLDRNYTEFADIPADPFTVYYSAQTSVSSGATWATMRIASRAARRFYLRLSVPLALIVTGTRAPATATTTAQISIAQTMHLYYNDTAIADSEEATTAGIVLTLLGGSSSRRFSAVVYVDNLVADLSVLSGADAVAVFTARVNAQATFTPPAGVTDMTATVVAHLPTNWTNSADGGASIAWTPSQPQSSSAVVLLPPNDA